MIVARGRVDERRIAADEIVRGSGRGRADDIVLDGIHRISRHNAVYELHVRRVEIQATGLVVCVVARNRRVTDSNVGKLSSTEADTTTTSLWSRA